MQIWAESGKSALPICNYSQILYQFLTFTQNLKRSLFSSLLCYPANKKIIRYAVYFAPLYVQNLKHIVNVFLEHSGEVRKVYLLSRHHRGNTDDTVVNFSCNLLLTA